MALIISACSEQPSNNVMVVDNSMSSINAEYKKKTQIVFPVGEENFEKLMAYVVKHGRLVDESSSPSSELNFTDSKGYCHNFLAIRSMEDQQVHQIKVWIFAEDPRFAKNELNIFGRYLITPKGVSSLAGEGIMEKAKPGYMELLELASK